MTQALLLSMLSYSLASHSVCGLPSIALEDGYPGAEELVRAHQDGQTIFVLDGPHAVDRVIGPFLGGAERVLAVYRQGCPPEVCAVQPVISTSLWPVTVS
jgi:hypothetical protein